MPRLTRHAGLTLVIITTLLVAGCSGGGDGDGGMSKPEQIAGGTIQPTATAEPTDPPATWTPAPTRTLTPPPPTLVITARPTSTVFAPPIATPLAQQGIADASPTRDDPVSTAEGDSAGNVAEDGEATSPAPIRVDLAPLTARNAAQLALIQARENVFAADLAPNPNPTASGILFAAATREGVSLYSDADLTVDPQHVPDTGSGADSQVEAVVFNPTGSRIASGNAHGELVIWDIATAERHVTIQAHSATVWDMVYSPDGTQIVTGGGDGLIKVWNAVTGDLVRDIQTGETAIYDLAVYPLSGLVVASGPDSNRANVWNLSTGEELAPLRGHSLAARAVAFGPDGETLASGGGEGSVRIWTVAGAQANQPDAVLGGHTSMITAIAYSPDSTLMAVGTSAGALAIWDLTTGGKLVETQAHSPWVRAILWLRDQSALLTTGSDGALRVWGVPAQ